MIHGMSYTRTYAAWHSMKHRCDNPNNPAAKSYSELDITYEPKWVSFVAFYADMGECPKGFQLDRINNNRNYSKENCRWTTAKENVRNRSSTKLTAENVKHVKAILMATPKERFPKQTYIRIGKMFGVGPSCIYDIDKGRNWKDVA